MTDPQPLEPNFVDHNVAVVRAVEEGNFTRQAIAESTGLDDDLCARVLLRLTTVPTPQQGARRLDVPKLIQTGEGDDAVYGLPAPY